MAKGSEGWNIPEREVERAYSKRVRRKFPSSPAFLPLPRALGSGKLMGLTYSCFLSPEHSPSAGFSAGSWQACPNLLILHSVPKSQAEFAMKLLPPLVEWHLSTALTGGVGIEGVLLFYSNGVCDH